MLDTRYYFIDTETTDAGPTASVCEVGWVETDADFNIVNQVESLIDPQQMISPGASGVHGLTNKDVADSPTLAEFFSADDPGCYGKPFGGSAVAIGHRVSFDLRFLGGHFETLDQDVCTLRWARKLYPHADDHKLSTLIYALDLPRSPGAHRVMADVMSAYYLAKHVCERLGGNLAYLTEASREPMEVMICPFGKHKGVAFKDIPRGYLSWMSINMKDLDQDMLYTLGLHLNKKKNQ